MVAAVKVSEFDLTGAEHARLARVGRRRGRGAVRARIVLACSEPGVVYAQLADELGVSVMTVHNVRRRFAESRLAGLADRPRSGRPKAGLSLSDGERDQLRRWASRATSTQALALRSKIILVGELRRDFNEVNPRQDWRIQFTKGQVGHVLIQQAAHSQLLVVGTREHGGVERVLAGSVNHVCLMHAPSRWSPCRPPTRRISTSRRPRRFTQPARRELPTSMNRRLR